MYEKTAIVVDGMHVGVVEGPFSQLTIDYKNPLFKESLERRPLAYALKYTKIDVIGKQLKQMFKNN